SPHHIHPLSLHDALPIFVCVSKNQRRHEFIRLVHAILSIQSSRWRFMANLAISENDCVPSFLGAIPPMIAVHREISSNYRHNLRSEEHTSELQSRENLVC